MTTTTFHILQRVLTNLTKTTSLSAFIVYIIDYPAKGMPCLTLTENSGILLTVYKQFWLSQENADIFCAEISQMLSVNCTAESCILMNNDMDNLIRQYNHELRKQFIDKILEDL